MSRKIRTKAAPVAIKSMRNFANAILTRRYGKIGAITGWGRQPGTRVKFTDDGKELICAVKVVSQTHGRISFAYKSGTWGALSESDRVLYIRQLGSGEFEAQMHAQSTILAAFIGNRKAAEANDSAAQLPWLSPEQEKGDRYLGSGFGKDALWTEFSGKPASTIPTPKSTPPIGMGELEPDLDDDLALPALPAVAAAIAKAKATIAAELGVRVTAIAINVRL
jgi:hypothetical protein